MKMDRRLTNGLAWAGALLVIGIPAADYLTGAFANSDAPSVAVVTADAEAPTPAAKPDAQTSAPAAAKPEAVASSADPVSGLLQSGKPLPSYITGGTSAASTPAKPAATPAKPAATASTQPAATPSASQPAQASTPARPPIATQTPDQQVAALPAKVAPTPMPLSMRPRPVAVPLASNEPPLIIDQPTPPASLPQAQPLPDDIVTSQDLDTWEAGPLSDFLAKRNQRSSATYEVQQNVPEFGYDSNGFWLDQAPRGNQTVNRRRDDDVIYLPY